MINTLYTDSLLRFSLISNYQGKLFGQAKEETMSIFFILFGFFGFVSGICFFIYSFFSKKKIPKKNIVIEIIATFIIMMIGGIIAPPDTHHASTHSNAKHALTSSSTSNTSESRAKEEQKTKELMEKKKQEEIKQKTSAAETALSQAEANPTRDNYNAASTAIQSIPGGNQDLSNRLASVDSTIKANEAAEAERQKQAQIAQEQAEQQQQASQEQTAQTQQNNEQTVYITPEHGKKYHLNPNCPGLNNASSIQSINLQDAINQGYTACKRG